MDLSAIASDPQNIKVVAALVVGLWLRTLASAIIELPMIRKRVRYLDKKDVINDRKMRAFWREFTKLKSVTVFLNGQAEKQGWPVFDVEWGPDSEQDTEVKSDDAE